MICLKGPISNAHGRRQEESQEGMNQIIEGLKAELSNKIDGIKNASSFNEIRFEESRKSIEGLKAEFSNKIAQAVDGIKAEFSKKFKTIELLVDRISKNIHIKKTV